MSRWMTSKDLYEVSQTERETFGKMAICEERLHTMLLSKIAKMVVFEDDREFAGYAIYCEMHRDDQHYYDVNRLVVVPEHRRKKIASRWINALKAKAFSDKNQPIVRGMVSEKELGSHLFAKANGFHACQAIDIYGGEDYYLFIFDPKQPAVKPAWRSRGDSTLFTSASELSSICA